MVYSASLPSPLEGSDRETAATSAWTGYCARRKEQGDASGARNRKVRALVYAAVAHRETDGSDGTSTVSPYPGPTAKAPDGTTSTGDARGAIRAYPRLVPRTEPGPKGDPEPVTDERGRRVYDSRSDLAVPAVPMSAVKRIVGRYRIGLRVVYPKLSGYGAYVAVLSTSVDGSVTVGTVIPAGSVGRMLADIGIRLAPDRVGALLVPCSVEHVDEWASHVHGDRSPEAADEAAYEDALVVVSVGQSVLAPERESRASDRARDRLAAGAGTESAPVLRATLATDVADQRAAAK